MLMPSPLKEDPSKVMVIRQITKNITTFGLPFFRNGLIKVGLRGTVVRLKGGSLAVFSPPMLTEEVKAKIAELGEVRYIAALDFEHHMQIGPWYQQYPQAKVIGVEGLPEKRAKQGNEDVPFAHVFTSKNKDSMTIDPEFDAEFDYEYIPAHANKELVFYHKPDRTLIEADFMFNLPAKESFSKSKYDPTSGLLTKLMCAINNTKGDALWQKRLIWYALAAKDRQGFSRSVAKVDKWDFDRIIPCHGEVIESGAKGVFRKVFEWQLEAARKQA